MESGEFRLNEESIAPENIDTDDDFAAQVDNQGGEEQEELVRLGTALNEIRDIMGRAFFARISMVSGDINSLIARRVPTAKASSSDRR